MPIYQDYFLQSGIYLSNQCRSKKLQLSSARKLRAPLVSPLFTLPPCIWKTQKKELSEVRRALVQRCVSSSAVYPAGEAGFADRHCRPIFHPRTIPEISFVRREGWLPQIKWGAVLLMLLQFWGRLRFKRSTLEGSGE